MRVGMVPAVFARREGRYPGQVIDLPDRPFDAWTIDEVRAAVEGEPVDVLPGTGRQVPGNRRKLLNATEAAGVTVAGDLPCEQRNRYHFSIVSWPKGLGVPIGT